MCIYMLIFIVYLSTFTELVLFSLFTPFPINSFRSYIFYFCALSGHNLIVKIHTQLKSKYLCGFVALLNHTSISECFKIPYLFLTLNFNVQLYFSSILFTCHQLVTIISYFIQLRLSFTYIFINYLCLLLLLAIQAFLLS